MFGLCFMHSSPYVKVLFLRTYIIIYHIIENNSILTKTDCIQYIMSHVVSLIQILVIVLAMIGGSKAKC